MASATNRRWMDPYEPPGGRWMGAVHARGARLSNTRKTLQQHPTQRAIHRRAGLHSPALDEQRTSAFDAAIG